MAPAVFDCLVQPVEIFSFCHGAEVDLAVGPGMRLQPALTGMFPAYVIDWKQPIANDCFWPIAVFDGELP